MAYHNYETRKLMLEAIRYVDLVIPKEDWSQKIDDIKKYQVDLLVMGDDWSDSEKFTSLKEYCEIRFFPRTKRNIYKQNKKRAISPKFCFWS